MRTNLFRAAVLTLVTLTVVAGCGSAKDDKKAAEDLKIAMGNSSEIMSGGSDMTFTGKISTDDPGAGFKELDGSVRVNGVFDIGVDQKLAMTMEANGSADGGQEQSLQGEMRISEKKMYFMVKDLDKLAIPPQYKAMISPFLNKWWYAEAPQEFPISFGMYGNNEDLLTPEQKEIKKLSKDTMWFKDVKDMGDDKVDGVEAVKYSVKLDNEALLKFTLESQRITGAPINPNKQKEMEKFFKLMNFEGNAWVSKKDNVVIKIDGDLNVSPDKEAAQKSTFALKISYVVSNLNGKVNVEIPSGAEKFDPFATMSAGKGL